MLGSPRLHWASVIKGHSIPINWSITCHWDPCPASYLSIGGWGQSLISSHSTSETSWLQLGRMEWEYIYVPSILISKSNHMGGAALGGVISDPGVLTRPSAAPYSLCLTPPPRNGPCPLAITCGILTLTTDSLSPHEDQRGHMSRPSQNWKTTEWLRTPLSIDLPLFIKHTIPFFPRSDSNFGHSSMCHILTVPKSSRDRPRVFYQAVKIRDIEKSRFRDVVG